jgi:hypothetical protein
LQHGDAWPQDGRRSSTSGTRDCDCELQSQVLSEVKH